MDDIVFKACVNWNTEKRTENFYKKYSECKAFNIKRVLRRYYKIKDEILQQRRDKHARSQDLDNRLKALKKDSIPKLTF